MKKILLIATGGTIACVPGADGLVPGVTAAQLLATTDRAVTEIALDCGFASPSYFTKQFRKMVGAAPMEYRKAHT